MAEHRDMIDDLIDIQSDWRAVSNPLGNIAGTLAANPEDVIALLRPGRRSGRGRLLALSGRVSGERHRDRGLVGQGR